MEPTSPHTRMTGKVLQHTKGFANIELSYNNTVICRYKGNLFAPHQGIQEIAIGDDVEIDYITAQQTGVVHRILERKSIYQRKKSYKTTPQIIATNLNVCAITAAFADPPIKNSLVARFMMISQWGNMEPLFILTKSDLVSPEQQAVFLNRFARCGLTAFATSTQSQTKKAALLAYLKHKKTIFVGQSGVGKSSLLNSLFPKLQLRTGAVNSKTQKGIHTTTLATTLRPQEDFFLVDTPGIREFQLFFHNLTELGQNYRPFFPYAPHCWAKNCLHDSEPKCAVQDAVREGLLSNWLYQGYIKCLQKERLAGKK